MSARVYVHPRCWDGPAMGALSSYLETDRKWDMTGLSIGPLSTRRRRELVRTVEQVDGATVYERLDGSRFKHYAGHPAPEGVA